MESQSEPRPEHDEGQPKEEPTEEIVEEPVTEEVALPEEDVSGDDPLTGEEIKSVVADSWSHAKNVWLKPARKEVRRGFNNLKRFLNDLGDN